jgi:hypothetical protein
MAADSTRSPHLMHLPKFTTSSVRQGRRRIYSSGITLANHRAFHASFLVVCFLASCIGSISQEANDFDGVDYGNHNLEWEDGPSSWEEFGHDNDPSVCGVQLLTVEEWEAGRYWEGKKPVLVTGVTDDWPALNNWKL